MGFLQRFFGFTTKADQEMERMVEGIGRVADAFHQIADRLNGDGVAALPAPVAEKAVEVVKTGRSKRA